MTRPPRNPHRAYDHDGREIPPMSLGNMREHGVRDVPTMCQQASYGHLGSINVDHLPDSFPVPDVSLRLVRCAVPERRDAARLESWRMGLRSRATARMN